VTPFTTELATPSVTDERTLRTDTLPRLIYKDDVNWGCELENFLYAEGVRLNWARASFTNRLL